MKINKGKEIYYISVLAVLSTFAVVFTHVNGCFWSFSKSSYWVSANIIESIFYFAVPIFFMISGATLINYKERYNTKVFFKKRIKKVVIPFLIWSIIGFFAALFVRKTVILNNVNLLYIINGILTSEFIPYYWFFIPLIAIYLILPLFASIPKDNRINLFKYLCSIIFIFNVLIPFLSNIFNLNILFSNDILIFSTYLIYPLLGYLLNEIDLSKNYRILFYLLGLFGLILHLVGTYYLSYNAGVIVDTYKGFLNVPCILYSISIWILVKSLVSKYNLNRTLKLVNFIKPYTFSIYLLHAYVIFISFIFFDKFSLIYRLIMPFIIVFICIVITYILRKIIFIREILPP